MLTSIFCGVGGQFGDCAGYVKVVAYISYCIYLFCNNDTIILVMYAKDSHSEWFYMWLIEFLWFFWFITFNGVCWYLSN